MQLDEFPRRGGAVTGERARYLWRGRRWELGGQGKRALVVLGDGGNEVVTTT